MYCFANIAPGTFNYLKAFNIGLYLSFLVINENLKEYTVNELIKNLEKTDKTLFNEQETEKYFRNFKNREFALQINN